MNLCSVGDAVAATLCIVLFHSAVSWQLTTASSTTADTNAPNSIIILDAKATLEEQRGFLQKHTEVCGHNVVHRWQALQEHKLPLLARELYKYCAFRVHLQREMTKGVLYVDPSTALEIDMPDMLSKLSPMQRSVAIRGDPTLLPNNTIHGSFLLLNRRHAHVATDILDYIMQTPIEQPQRNLFLIPQKLHTLIHDTGNPQDDWTILQMQCLVSNRDPIDTHSTSAGCPIDAGNCCVVYNQELFGGMVLTTAYPLVPQRQRRRAAQDETLPLPFHPAHTVNPTDLPFVSTVRELAPSDTTATGRSLHHDAAPAMDPLDNDPQYIDCKTCLSQHDGKNRLSHNATTAQECNALCQDYVVMICKDTDRDNGNTNPLRQRKTLVVTPPIFQKDATRRIPRIIHQSFKETITKQNHPQLWRLIQSWRQSGWEYHFYNNTEASAFLRQHFPEYVAEAFESVIPGAFKADLFRVCVLAVHGGVWADMDVLLESNLEVSIPPHVGFATAMDSVRTNLFVGMVTLFSSHALITCILLHRQPGHEIGEGCCVWNGIMAAAPGHPILLRNIEIAVNHIRNRYTVNDLERAFCPNPKLMVIRYLPTLFVSGPCILGVSINQVLGRPSQEQIEPGELNVVDSQFRETWGTIFIWSQNKTDMGEHRFSWPPDGNRIVAATRLRAARATVSMKDHYTKLLLTDEGEPNVHANLERVVFGTRGVYTDLEAANEYIDVILPDGGSLGTDP